MWLFPLHLYILALMSGLKYKSDLNTRIVIWILLSEITDKPQDHWSCIAHLSAEDILKSAVIEEKSFKILNLSDLDQGQWMTLTFGTHTASRTHLVDCVYQLLYHRLQ